MKASVLSMCARLWIPIVVSAAALGTAARYTMQAFGEYLHRHEAA
jgi:hypothetical protein